MAIRNIVKEGDPILNKVCRPVTNFDDRLATLLDDMRETMIAADGVGPLWGGASPVRSIQGGRWHGRGSGGGSISALCVLGVSEPRAISV